ncbi:transmembrane protein, putative (macronuclear) [Tetrahymena thermophila SB210]|uniref:Transmembrane protein, putative n=1 Tax=Tetrahymena thermophila (strain SB210) TaxID=312017 RepID=Q234C8_TETTS|nr:transmembrane protein, putative [Tetrahymena thermophila SB210]EAR92075.2 transmembrane protein, putative [Tetrahymena thermophila SB210]|eukprot:XP_001012320.2 transmembrane protein, putative [Tetrahymena thermophila SB210]
MSSNGCSRSYIIAAVFSFIYVALNSLFIFWSESSKKCFNLISCFGLLCILLASLVALGFSFAQSTCQIIVCYNGEGSQIDDFYLSFYDQNKSTFENDNCGKANNKQIAQYVSQQIAEYAGEKQFDSKKLFYILKGWPISFLILSSILAIIHMIYVAISHCNCKDITNCLDRVFD